MSLSYAKHFANRSIQNDDEFMDRFSNTDIDREFVLSLRRVIAMLGQVPMNCVRAEDRFTQELFQLPFWCDTDSVRFVDAVKAETGIDLGDDAIGNKNFDSLPDDYTVAGMILDISRRSLKNRR